MRAFRALCANIFSKGIAGEEVATGALPDVK
jgi:hypothetical protein